MAPPVDSPRSPGPYRPSLAKTQIPVLPAWVMARPRTDRRLDQVLARRLGLVVAGAGFGKSTLLAAWAARHPVAWYSLDADDRRLGGLVLGAVEALRRVAPAAAEELAGLVSTGPASTEPDDSAFRAQAFGTLVSDVLAERLERDVVLVLDDVHEIEESAEAIHFVESLIRLAPPRLHLVVATRHPLPFPVERLRGRGQVLEIDGAALAFELSEVRQLLIGLLGIDAADLAVSVHEMTGGWPAAVVLTVEALRDGRPAERRAILRRLRHPEGSLIGYIAEEALARERPETISWLRLAAHFERFTRGLLEDVGWTGGASAFAEERPSTFLQAIPDEPGWYRLHGLIREYALARLHVDPAELRDIQCRAAAWFEARGLIDEALRARAAAGDTEGVARLLRDRGASLLAAGAIDRIVAAEESLPDDLRGSGSERVFGDALLARGDWMGALAAFQRAGGEGDELEAGLAWRIGLLEYLRGELPAALASFGRARLDGSAPIDEALALAWTASALWLFGEVERCRPPAERALALAEQTGDDRALAAANMAAALVAILEGDMPRSERHHRIALVHAERAGDVLQIIRVRDNLGDHLLEEGRYREALEELDGAVRLADAVGFASYHAFALANRGQAHLGLGHFEEAIADFSAARAIYQRIGSSWISYAILKQANLHRIRGDMALARAGYEDAIRGSERTGDRQVLVPSLVGLAQAIALDHPDRARSLAARAVDLGREMMPVVALLGAARVALDLDDRDEALRLALDAGHEATARRDRPGLASALEVQAVASSAEDRGVALDVLDEALAIWRECGSPVGEARNILARAQILDGSERRAQALEAERRFLAMGARGAAARAHGLADAAEAASRPPVAIEALGNFRVLRDGHAVGTAEWQSKKARDLLKMLVARRGRAASREALIEALWPEEDPEPLGNRFSVALTTVRTVLDPARRFPADHFVRADKNAVALDVERIAIDVQAFFVAVDEGRRLQRIGRSQEALACYAAAESAYGGDFLEEDPFEEWAAPLREEAQAAYIAVTRAVAEAAARSGDDETATRLFLRILDRDAFDESAHLGLVTVLLAVGRHGEARRRYGLYATRMAEIGVEAAPFPAPQRAAMAPT